MIEIYTDGSSIIGKDKKRYAGAGIYFGLNDQRNSIIPVEGEHQTNQYAELTALYYALKFTKDCQDVRIFTDSQWTINCLTKWHIEWKRNGWKTSKGESVTHKIIISQCIDMIEARKEKQCKLEILHVLAHKGNPGNEAADKLAKEASSMNYDRHVSII
jgi:ribonuclease HI